MKVQKRHLEELVKPEGIEGSYEEYDKSVQDLMDTMTSIVQTSLDYNDSVDINPAESALLLLWNHHHWSGSAFCRTDRCACHIWN